MCRRSRKGHAAAAEALHDEALAAEEARTQPLVEVDGQLYSRHGGRKALFWRIISWPGVMAISLIWPGKLEPKAIIAP